MLEALQMPFFQHALIAGVLIAVAIGLIGPLTMANKMTFMSGGIAHATYGGVGAAIFFGFSILLGATLAALLAAAVISVISYRYAHRADTAIGIVWAVGMAIGVILSDLTPGYNVDLMSFLFGSILAVGSDDLWIMGFFDIVALGLVWFFYYDFMALSFDPVFAKLQGVKTQLLHLLLLGLVAITVVLAMRLVGLIMVIALLTMPSFSSERYVKSLGGMMLFSILLSACYIVGGLFFAYWYDLSSGASVILVAAFGTIALFMMKNTLKFQKG
ncbi:metal ABC transporter permease [Hydrogenimonas cancrithermarum]|uniref:ABC transporter permease n=1 Tax=Hydrogenimonas cancrithermarum TaxID=2993563 RepID=A0ABM8FNA9_9BACT|nr:metal ABC transporter permease [Hydrogenimonas cancrithermarum]BDY13063.1 ABC transporter permease [Hydrogenimonas cancrithermarum]